MRVEVAIAKLERRLAKKAKRVERLIEEVGKIEAVLDALKEAQAQRSAKLTPAKQQNIEGNTDDE